MHACALKLIRHAKVGPRPTSMSCGSPEIIISGYKLIYIGPADHVTFMFRWQACIVDIDMDGVDLVVKERYKQKLESVGLLLSDDPCVESNSHRFSDDMSLWPRIEYEHIFGYSLEELH